MASWQWCMASQLSHCSLLADSAGWPADLDHTNEGLRKGIVDWMNWLKEDIGFTNWRFDFVKGYGVRLPWHAQTCTAPEQPGGDHACTGL